MNRKQLVLFTVLTFILSGYSIAQKIKYKDLFYLLNAKKYDEVEPFLKSFLSNPKEADHPNANFQMGIIFHEKSKVNDVLIDTENRLINIDSATHYYNLAKSLITEKEIKKNDEYYEAYYRRDLRTGKMGIKISDVQLDIETRVSELEASKLKIIDLKRYFDRANDFYLNAQKSYETLVNQFETEKQFFLRSDDSLIETLGQIKNDYDSSMGNFGRYKIVLGELEFPGYKQVLKVNEIANIKTDGLSKADFLKSTIDTWNYDKWSSEMEKKIKNEVLPIHNSLIEYDKGLNNLYDKINNDSVSVIKDLSELNDSELRANVANYDDDPFPFSLFELKKAELGYLSDRLELLRTAELLNIDKQLVLTRNSLRLIYNIDSIINNKITKYNLSNEALNYKYLVETQYEGVNGLTTFIQDKLKLVTNEKEQLANDLELLEEKSRWLIYQSDSIPLFQRDTGEVFTFNTDKTYVFLDKISISDTLSFTYGIKYDFNRKPFIYFSGVMPTHSTETIVEFEIDATTFAIDSISSIAVKKVMDDDTNTYLLLYSTNYNDQPTNGHLFRVRNDLTLSWEKSITLLYPPDVLTISNDFGVIAINYNVQYIDKSKGLQLISRELYNLLTGELIKEKK